MVVWHKPGARPHKGRFTNAAEYLVWGSNGHLGAQPDAPCLPGLYSVTSPRGDERIHIDAGGLLETWRAMCSTWDVGLVMIWARPFPSPSFGLQNGSFHVGEARAVPGAGPADRGGGR